MEEEKQPRGTDLEDTENPDVPFSLEIAQQVLDALGASVELELLWQKSGRDLAQLQKLLE